MADINTVQGYCTITDLTEYLNWLEEEGYKRKNDYYGRLNNGGWFNDNWQNYFHSKQSIFGGREVINVFEDSICDKSKRETEKFTSFLTYMESINQQICVYYTDDFASLIGFGKKRFVIPTKWVIITMLKDYKDLPLSQLKTLGCGADISGTEELSVLSNDSVSQMLAKKDAQEEEIKNLEQDMKDVKEAKTKELADMQAEIDKMIESLEEKKRAQMAELNKKMEAMAAMKEEMEQQIFMLETQIYGIRCYLGEVVDFIPVVSGKSALFETPLVMYQKIRFLDEELGKALAIYQFDGSEGRYLLDILKNREDIRELLAPGEKSISFVRVSATGTCVGMHPNIANTLTEYEVYHGGQLAVFVRNGENLHIAWLDDDKIKIHDGNVFMKAETRIDDIDEAPVTESSTRGEMVSRYFIYSLLQGLLDNSNLLNVEKNNIIFSTAEGWVQDKKYGDFADIINRISDMPLYKGDMVFTTMSITRDDSHSTRYQRNNNDRGIGYANRTHDAHIPSLKALPVNKIVRTLTYRLKYRDYKVVRETEDIPLSENSWTTKILSETVTDEVIKEGVYDWNVYEIEADRWKGFDFDFQNPTKNMDELLEKYDKRNGKSGGNTQVGISFHDTTVYCRHYYEIEYIGMEKEYYISAKKSGWSKWEGKTDARANMQFFIDEVIPLSYLNSVWVTYAITTKNIGEWRVAGTTLSYADSLMYLNHLLEYLKKREEEERVLLENAGLGSYMEENPEWQVVLSEWKIANEVRTITDYQAKRFAKSVQG